MTDEKSFFAEHFPTLTTWVLALVGGLVASLRYLIIGPILSRLTKLEEQNLQQHDSIMTIESSVRSIKKKLEDAGSKKAEDDMIERMAKAQMEVLQKAGWEPPKPPR